MIIKGRANVNLDQEAALFVLKGSGNAPVNADQT